MVQWPAEWPIDRHLMRSGVRECFAGVGPIATTKISLVGRVVMKEMLEKSTLNAR